MVKKNFEVGQFTSKIEKKFNFANFRLTILKCCQYAAKHNAKNMPKSFTHILFKEFESYTNIKEKKSTLEIKSIETIVDFRKFTDSSPPPSPITEILIEMLP